MYKLIGPGGSVDICVLCISSLVQEGALIFVYQYAGTIVAGTMVPVLFRVGFGNSSQRNVARCVCETVLICRGAEPLVFIQ